jgi:hypothetical protein
MSNITYEFFKDQFAKYTLKPIYTSDTISQFGYNATVLMKGDTSTSVWLYLVDGMGPANSQKFTGTFVAASNVTEYLGSIARANFGNTGVLFAYLSNDPNFTPVGTAIADSVLYTWEILALNELLKVTKPNPTPTPAGQLMTFDANGNAVPISNLAENAWTFSGMMAGTKKLWYYLGVTTSAPTRDTDITMVTIPNIQDVYSLEGFLYAGNNIRYPINFYRRASQQSICTYIGTNGAVQMGWGTQDTSDNNFASKTMRWLLLATRTDA